MADIRDFESELTAILGYEPTSASAKELLIHGCYDVISRFRMIKPTVLSEFASELKLNDGSGYDLGANSVYEILNVARLDAANSVTELSLPIQSINRFAAIDTDSLFLATTSSPMHYVLNQKLFILPAPTVTDEGYISLIGFSTVVTNYDTAPSSISGFPLTYNNFILLYAAYNLLNQKIASYPGDSIVSTALSDVNTALDALATISTSIGTAADTTEFDAAIAKVSAIISTQTSSWDSFVTDEDPEMSQAALTGAQVRVTEAQAELGAISAGAQGLSLQAQTKAQELAGYINLVQARLGEIVSDINIYKSNVASIREQYEALFVPYGSK